MAHGKDPAFPLYAMEWRTDLRLRILSRDQRALLVDLWAVAWTEAVLPDDPEALSKLVDGTPSEVASLLAEFFVLEDGFWHSERLEAEREERELLRAKRSEAGKRGGVASGRSKRKAKPKQRLKQTGSKAEAKPKPSASASSSDSPNPSDVSRTPRSGAQPPSPHAPDESSLANGVPGGSEGASGAGVRIGSSQEASESPTARSGTGNVSPHQRTQKSPTAWRTVASTAKPDKRRGPIAAGSVMGAALRHLGGGAA